MTAAVLLTFIGASVWIVLDRCMVSAADSTQRMRAFEIARENMEKLIALESVQEMTEYGISEKYADIRWQSTIETFYDGQASGMWARAVCRAEFTDTAGENRAVELTHWLTKLTAEQEQQLMGQQEAQKQQLAKHIIETEELAAEYAGVSVETIRLWVKNGMPTAEGAYLKPWLDSYFKYDGNPSYAEKQRVITEYPELSKPAQTASPAGQDVPPVPGMTDEPEDDEPDTDTEAPMVLPPRPPG